MNRKFVITIAAILVAAVIPVTSWALSMPKDLLTYTVSVTPSDGGQLYWNYGKNMEFFLCNGSDAYNQKCRISKKESYKFSSLVNRGIVPKADQGWYFDGFYDRSGSKLAINPLNIDIIRITIDGKYLYDYVLSFDNTVYKNYTKKKYQEMTRAYLRSIFETSRYKVMFKSQFYDIPEKSADLYPRFRAKSSRNLKHPIDRSKVYGNSDFLIWPGCPDDAAYKSSNSKVLSVDKVSGLCKIKGEGVATVTITLPETETLLAETVKVKVRIRPVNVSILSAQKKDAKTLEVKWKTDPKCSGYEIEVGADSSFSKITAKKTIGSAKTDSTKITLPKNAVATTVRIKAFKRSCGEKLYGEEDRKKISKN